MAGGGTAINNVTFNPLKTTFTVNSSEYEDAGSITINCSGTPDSGVYIASISSSDTSIAEATEDALSRATSGNNVITNFSVRPKSAGTVTLTASAFDYVNLRDVTGTLEITVTSADDQNFLNERGLAHFWGNIDTLKQDKLTAGTNITIAADNTISASQPTVGNATLTIQKNGASAGTFTANATSNKTINITVPTQTSELTNNSGFLTSSTGVTSVNGAHGAVTGIQTTSNLVTSVSSSSTNSQYPSAKLFYDTVGDVESVLQTLNSGTGV